MSFWLSAKNDAELYFKKIKIPFVILNFLKENLAQYIWILFILFIK